MIIIGEGIILVGTYIIVLTRVRYTGKRRDDRRHDERQYNCWPSDGFGYRPGQHIHATS